MKGSDFATESQLCRFAQGVQDRGKSEESSPPEFDLNFVVHSGAINSYFTDGEPSADAMAQTWPFASVERHAGFAPMG
jgi:hypothetical protein